MRLLAEKEALQSDLQALKMVTGMDYVPTHTKVLHLKANPSSGLGQSSSSDRAPSSIPMEEVRHLRKQNRELREEVSRLKTEEGSASSAEESTLEGHLSLAKGGSGSQSFVATSSTMDSAKLNQRLKEMFKERITCFREAVYLLTGYKVERKGLSLFPQ